MSVYSAAGRVAAVQHPWETPVRCHGSACTARATIRGFGLEAVYSRTDLYVSGWRQWPGTRKTYCPPCAGKAGLT